MGTHGLPADMYSPSPQASDVYIIIGGSILLLSRSKIQIVLTTVLHKVLFASYINAIQLTN